MKVLHIFTLLFTPKSFFDGQFKYLNDCGHEIWVISSSEEDLEFSKRNNVNYLQVDIERKISPFTDIKSILKIRSFIAREQFDVVIGHTPKGAMIAMIASTFTKTKHRVYYRHGLVYTTAHGIMRYILKAVERFTALCATKIINVSPSLAKLAITDKLNSREKQIVIGSGTCGGIDTEKMFNPALVDKSKQSDLKSKYGITKNDLVIGFCGRLCKDKGIPELVEGFGIFVNHHKELSPKLLLVGLLDERDILSIETLDKIKLNPNIIVTGFIEKHELPYYYSLMDIFVFPSHREGFGMCVIEASAMEVPILVSKSHGCIDSIVEGKTGEYINLSPEGIAIGLENMTDENKRLEYGNNGRMWVTKNFDWTIMWPQIAEFYTSLKEQ